MVPSIVGSETWRGYQVHQITQCYASNPTRHGAVMLKTLSISHQDNAFVNKWGHADM